MAFIVGDATKWSDPRALSVDDATLFTHDNMYGVWEGRSASAEFDQFDGSRYLAENPDVAAYVDSHMPASSRNSGALTHFLVYGAQESRAAYDTNGAAIDLGFVL